MTNDILLLSRENPCIYAHFLNVKGRILYDSLIYYRDNDSYAIEVRAHLYYFQNEDYAQLKIKPQIP